MAITTRLHVQELFLDDLRFSSPLLSRFSNDALENQFSTLKSKNPVPRRLEFRSALKAATHPCFYERARMAAMLMLIVSCLSGCPAVNANMTQ